MFIVSCGEIQVFDNEGYQLDDVIVRKEIAEFAIEMEIEMAKKDKKYGKDSMKYDLDFLINHLLSERKEVDDELGIYNKDNLLHPNLYIELLHEAIMCMIIKNKAKNLRG